MTKVSISILDCDFENITSEIKKINDNKIDLIHIDIMDGKFVNNQTEKLFNLNKISSLTNLKYDIHMMVEEPLEKIDEYIKYEPEIISIHIEKNSNLIDCIRKIKSYNINVGVAINPDTNISELYDILELIDLVLIMSVHPGKGGQKFINETIDKVKDINNKKNKNNFIISVDGGVNDTNSKDLINSGADILVSGSYLVKSDNLNNSIKSLLIH
ncbi:MAG: ribulose-phosphate 3-epimerase [Rhodothermaeota bacterium MED-G16]|nr:MAG: ribulose-phosphate 3-epimerase [Rhodothermaeota bacterium MED-G16]